MTTIFQAVARGGKHRCELPFEPVPATQPSDSLPASKERVEAYRQRLERGEDLWCEDDKQCQDGSKAIDERWWGSYAEETFRNLYHHPEAERKPFDL